MTWRRVADPHLRELAARYPVRADLTTRTAYSGDASIYRQVPAAVIEPRDTEELAAILRLTDLPITARGGGTSVAGNSIGSGLIIDFTRRFSRIIDIDPQARTATVQPGVILDELRAAAARHGLTVGPDPSTHSRCAIGGMIGNNACGPHSIHWGTTADNVIALRLLTESGELHAFEGGTDDPRITSALRDLRDRHLAVLRTRLGRFSRQSSGYGLHHLLPENGFHVAKALVGAEGTCGLITEATLRLVEAPSARALVVLGCPDIVTAAELAPTITALTVEGMGADLLAALRTRTGRTTAGELLPPGGAWLFCEVGGRDRAEALTGARELAREAGMSSVIVTDPDEQRALWRIREEGAGIVTRMADGTPAWPGWEDSAVPPANLAAYLRDLYQLLADHGRRGVPYGHFAEGCLHLRVDHVLDTPAGLAAYRRFTEDAADLVIAHSGSISGEHGDGRARSELLARMYPPEVLTAFAGFTAILDPANRFNPGVIIDPRPLDTDVRPGPGHDRRELPSIDALRADHGSIAGAVGRCVGVGKCRAATGPMCPSFQVTGDEVHSTRGRARVLAEMLRGDHLADGWRSEEVAEALDLCLSCKACATECPVNVDMSTYKAEFRHHHHAGRLRPRGQLALGALPTLARLTAGRPFTPLVNRLAAAPISRRVLGLEPRRPLPTFADRTFRQWFVARRARTEGTPVLLWPDTFTNHLRPAAARAAVEVLESLGHRVGLPAGDVCCGLTWHSTGALERTRAALRRSLRLLAPALAAGVPIIGLEPSCTVMLAGAADLLPGEPSATVLGGRIQTLTEFLASLPGPLPVLRRRAVIQPHCHELATRAPIGADFWARLGITPTVIGAGCCGLAGNFGYESGHWEVSTACGERELFPTVRAAAHDDLIIADGFSCHLQIRHGTDRRAAHLAEILNRGATCP